MRRAARPADVMERNMVTKGTVFIYAVESSQDVENLMVAKTGVFLRPADLSRRLVGSAAALGWPSILRPFIYFSRFIRQA